MKNFVVCGRFDGESEIVKVIAAHFDVDASRKLEELARQSNPDNDESEFYILFCHKVETLIDERVVIDDNRVIINDIACTANKTGLGNLKLSFMGYTFATISIDPETREHDEKDIKSAEIALKTLIESGFKYAKICSLSDDISAIDNFENAIIASPLMIDREHVQNIAVECGNDYFLIYDDEMLFTLLNKLEDNPAINTGIFEDRILRRTLHLFITYQGATLTVWEDMEGWFILSSDKDGCPADISSGYIMSHRKPTQKQLDDFGDTIKGYIREFSSSYTTLYEDKLSQLVSN